MRPTIPRAFGFAILAVLSPTASARPGEPLILTGHEGWVGGVSFSPNGKSIATACADRVVRLWDLPTGRLRLELNGHTDAVSAVAFAPDGKSLVSASFDGAIKVWDATSGRE